MTSLNRDHLHRAANGTWSFVAEAPSTTGKRRQLYRRGFATKKAALAALDDLRAEVASGTFVEPSGTTVERWLQTWLASQPTLGRRPSTVASYRLALERYVIPRVGGVKLQALAPTHVDGVYSAMSADGLSLRTVRLLHAVLGKAMADAERKGLISRNPVRRASPPSAAAARAKERRVWSPPELRAFLDATADHEHSLLFRLASMTGMRRGELAGLAWSSVDLDDSRLTVRSTIIDVRGLGPVAGDVKTSRSRRSIDLDGATVAALRRQRARQRESRVLIGAGWVESGLVFVMADGRPLNPASLSQAFDRAVVRSGLPRIRFHDLRHTHATHLLASGVNIKVVSERLGHASVSFTLDVYGHVMPGQQASAAAAVAALVDGSP